MTVSEAFHDAAVLVPTPNDDALPRRSADFATFCDALDYAAMGDRGLNFHDARGTLVRAYRFAELRRDALDAARRLITLGVVPGDRVALIAETGAEFAALLCGAIYAGAWPVPLPLPTSFGGKDNYIDQIVVQLDSCDPRLLLYPDEIGAMCAAAAARRGCRGLCWDDVAKIAPNTGDLPQADPDAICYLQYSSGSTRFPHGVAVTHRALLANLAGHAHSLKFQQGDRFVSWLPWYHDMGLVGCLLSPIANQVSVDYLRTEDFARRPLAWLDLISRNSGTSVSYSPTFGFDICARRISSQTNVPERFDLSRWRIAGNGADMIRADVMQSFANAFDCAGFSAAAFLPSYGLAEATLAVTMMPPGEGIRVEMVEDDRLSGSARDLSRPARYRAIVNCGLPLRGMEIAIRGKDGRTLPHHHIGKVWCRGSSVMHSYFRDPQSTGAALVGGWLDTGDMGYVNSKGYLFIVGRSKDMIIINGKNHWPQDIEWAVEQLPGFRQGDVAAFSIETEAGEEAPAVLVHCRVTASTERMRLRDQIRDKVRAITGMNCVVELVPPRTLPLTSSGKLSRAKAKTLYLNGEIEPYRIAA
jgi:fatty-acyl-CoA synthase